MEAAKRVRHTSFCAARILATSRYLTRGSIEHCVSPDESGSRKRADTARTHMHDRASFVIFDVTCPHATIELHLFRKALRVTQKVSL